MRVLFWHSFPSLLHGVELLLWHWDRPSCLYPFTLWAVRSYLLVFIITVIQVFLRRNDFLVEKIIAVFHSCFFVLFFFSPPLFFSWFPSPVSVHSWSVLLPPNTRLCWSDPKLAEDKREAWKCIRKASRLYVLIFNLSYSWKLLWFKYTWKETIFTRSFLNIYFQTVYMQVAKR